MGELNSTKPVVEARYSFAALSAAFDHLDRGAYGKIVIDVAGGPFRTTTDRSHIVWVERGFHLLWPSSAQDARHAFRAGIVGLPKAIHNCFIRPIQQVAKHKFGDVPSPMAETIPFQASMARPQTAEQYT
ncbi:hypothetical protein [Bordetella genomosp. 9]|uniref:hypothetical protein n=1 Tax=Bordetella genomosp. 9 TaxID=1416803 RepID=UPI0011781750|nr:hypothetical protein [Bordetella genomosp. 9]